MADDLIDIDKERRRRKPPSELDRSGKPVSQEDAALASEYARAYVSAESAAERRLEMAMLKINVDFSLRNEIQAAYAALKNPDPERAG
jgi:hypothetical protein